MTTEAIPFLYTGSTLTLYFGGKTTVIDRSFPTFNDVLNALKNGNWNDVINLSDLKNVITVASYGRVKVLADDSVYVDNELVHGVLINRLIAMIKEGFCATPILPFLDNLSQNPTPSAKADLYLFLEDNNIPITVDGCFLAYKVVNSNYKDKYTNSIDNNVGTYVSMPREQVKLDRTVTCDSGLHVCSREYIPFYGNPSKGDHIIIVKVNPKDVVSVPVDHKNAKMRVCAYLVIDELKGWQDKLKDLFTSDYSQSSTTDEVDEDWIIDNDNKNNDSEYIYRQSILNPENSLNLYSHNPLVENKSNKLSDTAQTERVRTVRKIAANHPDWSKKAIGDITGFSPRQVGRIISGEAWKDIK